MKNGISANLLEKTIQRSKCQKQGDMFTVQGIHYVAVSDSTRSKMGGRLWDTVVKEVIDTSKEFKRPEFKNDECLVMEPVGA